MSTDSTTADSRIKSTLFCPDCGHESRYDGDWLRVERSERIHYLCPDCRTEITTRPAADTEAETPFELWQAWLSSVPPVVRRAAQFATAPMLMAMVAHWRRQRTLDSETVRDD